MQRADACVGRKQMEGLRLGASVHAELIPLAAGAAPLVVCAARPLAVVVRKLVVAALVAVAVAPARDRYGSSW